MRVLCARSADGFWWRHHTAGAHEERSRAETREMPTGHKRHHSARLRQLCARGAVSRVQSTFSSCWDEVGEFKLTQDYIRGTYSYTRTKYIMSRFMYKSNARLSSLRCARRRVVQSAVACRCPAAARCWFDRTLPTRNGNGRSRARHTHSLDYSMHSRRPWSVRPSTRKVHFFQQLYCRG